LFERFELLASLAYLGRSGKDELRESVERGVRGGWVTMASRSRETAYGGVQNRANEIRVVSACFSKRDEEFFELFEKGFAIASHSMRW
jgi:hypothetical protein